MRSVWWEVATVEVCPTVPEFWRLLRAHHPYLNAIEADDRGQDGVGAWQSRSSHRGPTRYCRRCPPLVPWHTGGKASRVTARRGGLDILGPSLPVTSYRHGDVGATHFLTISFLPSCLTRLHIGTR